MVKICGREITPSMSRCGSTTAIPVARPSTARTATVATAIGATITAKTLCRTESSLSGVWYEASWLLSVIVALGAEGMTKNLPIADTAAVFGEEAKDQRRQSDVYTLKHCFVSVKNSFVAAHLYRSDTPALRRVVRLCNFLPGHRCCVLCRTLAQEIRRFADNREMLGYWLPARFLILNPTPNLTVRRATHGRGMRRACLRG